MLVQYIFADTTSHDKETYSDVARCMTFADCRPQTADCTPQTADCIPQTADYRPQTVDCRLHEAARL